MMGWNIIMFKDKQSDLLKFLVYVKIYSIIIHHFGFTLKLFVLIQILYLLANLIFVLLIVC